MGNLHGRCSLGDRHKKGGMGETCREEVGRIKIKVKMQIS
jgi:hypothetical protein